MSRRADGSRPPGEERTVFDPNPLPLPGERQAPGGNRDMPPSGAGPAGGPARHIRVGDVLNHIYEVKRFIARGGMGEVFEGVNVNTEEKVAIKVILRHLAADPLVQAMFRKEARLLTRLSHPGLVQYRVLAIEPEFGAFYIVTEYIDGPNLSERLADLAPSPAQIVGLLRKLAQGLHAAHTLGAVHRDISPDNVMLEGGRLEGAKIIDFGIAKDLNAAAQTIIGDGFAGKLNYVAPEQLGDFNREIGPWTDVYSLGLTIVAVSLGRDVNMGATLVETIDKRRAGLDLTSVPEELRPVLQRMLAPDPADRIRSMEGVLEGIDRIRFADPLPPLHASTPVAVKAGNAVFARGGEIVQSALSALRTPKSRLAVAGITAGLVAVAGIMAWSPWSGKGTGPSAASANLPSAGTAADAGRIAAARRALQTELRSLPCSWLDFVDMTAKGNDISLKLQGVSGRSADALRRLEGVLQRNGLRASSIDFGEVLSIGDDTCGPIDAFSAIRQLGAGRMTVEQHQFEMGILPREAGELAGKPGGTAVITFDLSGFKDEISLIGLEETGKMEQLTTNKEELISNSRAAGEDRRRIELNTSHRGWSGILMLTGQGPFPADLLTNTAATRGADWPQRFLNLARQQNWKAEMVWYRTVDEVPDVPAPVLTRPPAPAALPAANPS
ncbi:serine/threonine-protein kinase [Novosphingobium album (ex Liu et al. 2023)]|uniref:Serine/threonine-protein kinase n=1 Tax=Novosphingobium album (ex Liu et al. 2023) TaxID=3031130 RepID=A0ABT5WUX4_9SPHN|nr:serine/threonine-protein kinase [Novosphingobium album (ex Liu et al. 2023)]MDE8653710.1 serine/threonine-protein kinase [Novosphingobium album (ex Liu et al. 2023)]